MSTPGALDLSVVIPFYNEAENIRPLLNELRAALCPLGVSHEILAIDDGSRDATGTELATFATGWPEMRVIRFSRNCGQAAALIRGFHEANGRFIAMLDGDGQNPPAELARLWPMRHTADMIVGARALRHDTALRKAMSRIANFVRRTALHDGVADSGCSLKVFRREVVRTFVPLRTMYSFLPAFAASGGFTVRELPVAHRPRTAGQSKYGLRAMAIYPFLDMLSLCWILRRAVKHKE